MRGGMDIDGVSYTLLKDYDKGKYKHLTFCGKVSYLDARVARILINPCREAMNSESKGDLGLILATAVCAGISAASTFLHGQRAPRGKDKQYFLKFVRRYMNPVLQNIGPSRKTWATWLYEHVRCGLAHSFAVETGGIEYEVSSYVDLKPYGPEVDPSQLLEDFARGWQAYLRDVRHGGVSSALGASFDCRFSQVFHD
jgi:hypothetical protein